MPWQLTESLEPLLKPDKPHKYNNNIDKPQVTDDRDEVNNELLVGL